MANDETVTINVSSLKGNKLNDTEYRNLIGELLQVMNVTVILNISYYSVNVIIS